nr:hypothetical protein [Tanacetum cinerariifolium]
MDQNVDFSGDDQIQNPQYPDVQENSLTNDEFEAYTIANDANINDLQFKLDNFQKNQQDFQEKFEQMQDDLLNQIRNFMQNLYYRSPGEDKEHEATTDTELPSTEDIQPLPVQEPAQDSDICQLTRKECCVEAREEQEVKNVTEQLAKRGNRSIQSLQNFRVVHKRYEHLSITPETKSDEVTESNAENLLPIPSECEVALEDKKECDLPISENSPICDNHSDIFFDSKNDDDISVYDDDFEDIEYVEASLSDPEIVSVEEENVIQEEEEEKKSFLSDNSIPPGIENVADDPKGDIRFLEELLIDDSILSHESFDSNFEENPSIPRPPPEPSDVETDVGEEIPVVMNEKDKDVDYSSFIFVVFAKMFYLLSAKSEDTIFDPGIFD